MGLTQLQSLYQTALSLCHAVTSRKWLGLRPKRFAHS